MSLKTIQISFFAVFTVGVSILLFFILKPYLGVIFISGVFAVVFYPVYKRLIDKFKGKKRLAALVTTSLVLIFIIIPVVVLSGFLLKEAVDLYNTVALNGHSQNIIYQANVLVNKLGSLFPSGTVDFQVDFELYTRNILNWIIENFDSIFVAIFDGVLNFILMLITLYYFFVLGDKIKKGLLAWSPLSNKYDEEFIQTLKLSVDAVLRGRVLVAAIQGALIGIGFTIFGVGSPVLWGFVGGVASLIPVLGTSVVTVPAIAYLFISGNFAAGIGLLLWAALIAGLVDDFISMTFLKGRMKVHPLIVLFSVLGGAEVFGVIGFLVGPVIVSAFIALIKIYPFIMYRKQSDTP